MYKEIEIVYHIHLETGYFTMLYRSFSLLRISGPQSARDKVKYDNTIKHISLILDKNFPWMPVCSDGIKIRQIENLALIMVDGIFRNIHVF